LQAEGVLANGTRVQDGRAQVIENGGSVSLSISGVARCGSFDAQCDQAPGRRGQQRR